MNPNFFENFQALSTLFNLTRQAQLQNLPREFPLFTPPTQQPKFVLPQPTQALHYKVPATTLITENKQQLSQDDALISRIYYNNIQSELIKAQMLSRAQAGNSNAPRMITPLGTVISNEMNTNISRQQNTVAPLLHNNKMTQEFQVKSMVEFLILNFGIVSQSEIDREKQKYSHDETLSQVFNNLVLKYTSMAKTKEEMVKYVFRKALKAIKDKLKGSMKRSDKEVTKAFCQKYFSLSKEEILGKSGIDIDNEEELLKLMLPFKKTSTNKTLNANFLSGIFGSEEFCAAYEGYLWEFEREADYDNAQKIKKFVEFIMSCIKSNKVSHILSYKRVPWLRTWILSTKNIGYQLMYERSTRKMKKMVKLEKVEFTASNCFETSDSECKAEADNTPETC